MSTDVERPPARPDGLPAYYPETYRPDPAERPSPFKRIGGAIAAALAVIAKFATKIKLLLVALPKVKLFATSASMLVSVAAYALLWPWQVAIGLVALIFVHELGHAIQIRREGVNAGWPVFIPFFGAYIGMKEMPKDAAAEARVGLAGPVLGSIGALVPLAIYAATGSDLFRALAFLGFFINLFNLLPVLPLDGGRAMAALSPKLWALGFAALIAVGFALQSPFVILILLLGSPEILHRWRARKHPTQQAYFKVRPAIRAAVAAVYVGLAGLLVLGIDQTHLVRHIH